MIVPTIQFGNQYFFGANLIASLYRQDDTLQIVNSPRLFFLPEPITQQTLPFYPIGNSKPLKVGDESITVVRDLRGVTVQFDIPVKGTIDEESLEPVSIILDPRHVRSPFPGSNTVIVSVPLFGDPQLITSVEQPDTTAFTISRTGTPIHLKKQMTLKNNRFIGTITVPDFLLGGKVPDSLGLNVVIPKLDSSGELISFVPGDLYLQYSPILFPLFVKSEIPTETPTKPYHYFGFWFLFGLVLSAILVLIKKTPKLTGRSLKEPGSDLIVLIEEHITNKSLTADFLAAKLGCSVHNVNREIVKVTGLKLKPYIESLRIEIVKERLASSNASEIEIATACGFKNVSSMEDAFHRIVGIAPYQFRTKYGVG